MKKGFTILELLVACLLLGIIVTILTMVFNQSSIAWRIGTEGVLDMDKMRNNIAVLREEADNAFPYGNQVYRLCGLWNEQGELRPRACNGPESDGETQVRFANDVTQMRSGRALTAYVGAAGGGGQSAQMYTVNVKSAGPDRKFNTYDDIWSFPDDPNEW